MKTNRENKTNILFRSISSFACILMIFLTVGCASAPLKPTIVPSNQQYKKLGKVRGSGGGLLMFGILPLGTNGRFERAYNQAIRRAKRKGGDTIIDPTFQDKWYWTPIGNGYTFYVEGEAVKYTK